MLASEKLCKEKGNGPCLLNINIMLKGSMQENPDADCLILLMYYCMLVLVERLCR